MPYHNTVNNSHRSFSLLRVIIPAAAIMGLGAWASAANHLTHPNSAAESNAQQDKQKVDTIMVDWRMLGGLNYETGEMTDTLKKLDGKFVKVPGFIVPLEDYEEEAAEFLLVPYFGACVHTPPPPPNQLVYVKMVDKKKLKVGLWDAVWMYGTLRVEFVESVYGPSSFTLDGLKTAPYGQ
jgi:hypothetical protein